MKFRKPLLYLGVLLIAVALIAISEVAAQAPGRSTAAARTAQEKEALTLLDKNQLVSARRVAEEVLWADPDSMVGHYVLGRVMYEAEGYLAQAMIHLGRAREIYENKYVVQEWGPNTPWEFHRQLLFTIGVVAGEIEEYEYQLQILDYHDALYDPDLTAEHAWPLMHLGRFDEARRFAKKAINSKSAQQRSLGLNLLCAIEGEAGKRQPYYEACLAAYENARKRDRKISDNDEKFESTLAVHAFNAAVAAQAALKPVKAEELAVAGTRRLAFTPANPWRFLVRLYVDQGRIKDAVASLREMQRWRRQQPPHVRDQVRAETDVAFATVLLLAAQTDIGLRSVDLALQRPDRRGLTSSTPEQALGAHALLRRALRRTNVELRAERASWSGWGKQVRAAAGGVLADFEDWTDDERIVQVLSDEERLIATFRVYLRGGIEPVPVWLLGDLVQVLGPGVVAAVLKRVRRLEPDKRVHAYCDAFGAEVRLAQGNEAEAIELAQAAMAKLPKTEALLRARSAAVGAEAARRAGRHKLSLSLFEKALQLDPSVIRRLGLAIPAQVVSHSSDPVAQLAVELIANSPRLRESQGGFSINLTGQGRTLRACLRTSGGTLITCARPTFKKGEEKLSADDKAQRIAEAFHRTALAMPLGLTGTDLSSLDGSTTVAEQAARDKLRNVLDDLVDDKKNKP